VVEVNKIGVQRIRVHWTDNTVSNVKESSLMRID